MMNKKGFIAEALVDFYSYIAFILIAIIFFLLFAAQSCEGPAEENIISTFEANEAEITLLNYLRSPVEGMSMNFAELIALAALDKTNYEEIFNKKTDDFFKDFAPGWQIKVEGTSLSLNRGSDCTDFEQVIPSPTGNLKVIFSDCKEGLGSIGPTVG